MTIKVIKLTEEQVETLRECRDQTELEETLRSIAVDSHRAEETSPTSSRPEILH